MFTDNIALSDVDGVIDRLCKTFNVNSDRALSLYLELSHSSIAMARKKRSLPYAAIVAKCLNENISLDYIFANRPKIIGETEPAQKVVTSSANEALAACALVQKVLDELLIKKNLPPERELKIRRKLQPILLAKVFELNFNELLIRTVAEGALIMA